VPGWNLAEFIASVLLNVVIRVPMLEQHCNAFSDLGFYLFYAILWLYFFLLQMSCRDALLLSAVYFTTDWCFICPLHISQIMYFSKDYFILWYCFSTSVKEFCRRSCFQVKYILVNKISPNCRGIVLVTILLYYVVLTQECYIYIYIYSFKKKLTNAT